MIVSVVKYIIKFKLKDKSIKFFNEDLPYLVKTPGEATRYDNRDAAVKVASRLIGLPRVIQRKFLQDKKS